MEQIKKAIDIVQDLEEKYSLSVEGTEQIRQQLEDFKVYIPLIGKFSSGKSALINNLLNWGDEICKENISVETAIPAEVFYGSEDCAWICRPEKEWMSFQEYLEHRDEITTENAEVVKMQLENEVLARFPDVALVDMPGLDSGYEVHDKAIERYIRKSMAYVLVFPADELTIPKSMEPILWDLNQYKMPMCVVITKGNRIADMEEVRMAELQKSLSKYFPGQSIQIFITETEDGTLGGFETFLEEMQDQANQLGRQYYRKKLEPEFARISNYLMSYLKNMELSLSELEEQKDSLQRDMEKLNATIRTELDAFTEQIPKLVNDVANDVQAALSEKMDDFVFDLLHDTDASSEINETVRKSMVSSYQNRVMGSIKKYLNHISKAISIGSTGYASALQIDMDQVCGKDISGVGRTATTVLGLLIGGPLGGIIAHVVTGLINKNNSERRKEARYRVQQQLSSSVFPAIDREVREKVQIDLERTALEVRQIVEKEVDTQMEALQKALEEVIDKKQAEDEEKAQRRSAIEEDLRILEEIHEFE